MQGAPDDLFIAVSFIMDDIVPKTRGLTSGFKYVCFHSEVISCVNQVRSPRTVLMQLYELRDAESSLKCR
jgi:hypothetical protein